MPKNKLNTLPKPSALKPTRPEIAAVLGLSPNSKWCHAGGLDIFVDQTADTGFHMILQFYGKQPCLDFVMGYRLMLIPEEVRMAVILPATQGEYLHGTRLDLWEVVPAQQMLTELAQDYQDENTEPHQQARADAQAATPHQ